MKDFDSDSMQGDGKHAHVGHGHGNSNNNVNIEVTDGGDGVCVCAAEGEDNVNNAVKLKSHAATRCTVTLERKHQSKSHQINFLLQAFKLQTNKLQATERDDRGT